MLSKNKIKQILSLSNKKQRKETRLFVAEGNKLVSELLTLLACKTIIATKDFLKEHTISPDTEDIIVASKEEIERVSQQNTSQSVVAVFRQPLHTLDVSSLHQQLSLMLNTVQDPGNLGTIIRIADWFGIREVICSEDTADLYNTKTVQATMGAIGRVRVHYVDLCALLDQIPEVPLFGTFLDGRNIYTATLPTNGIILMGNEGNGISAELEKRVTEKLFIPGFPPKTQSSESLNVAAATAIVCSEFRRRSFL